MSSYPERSTAGRGAGSLRGMTRCLVVLLLLVASVPAADWPQWRGPKSDGISPEKGLLKEWPSDGPPLAWRTKGVEIGRAHV